MEIVAALLVIAALGVVVWFVSEPIRRGASGVDAAAEREESAREALEAAKEAKYREIRETELDHRLGKLTDEDWRALDRQLRAEAVDILTALDQLDG